MKKIVACVVGLVMAMSLGAKNHRWNGVLNFGIDKWYADDYYLFYEIQAGIEYEFSGNVFGEFHYGALPNYRKVNSRYVRNSYAEDWALCLGYRQKLSGGKWSLSGEVGAGYQRYVEWIDTPPLITPGMYGPVKEDYFYPLLKVGLESKLSERVRLGYGLLKRFGKVEHLVVFAGLKVNL